MRILHLCLSNFYVDGYSYQENELVRQNVADGHEVAVIASTEVIGKDGRLRYVAPGGYTGQDNAPVERVRYSRWLPHAIMRKLRFHPGIYDRIERFAPDVILFHSACGAELLTAARYARDHPHVRFYVDSHEDFVNSARTFLSKWVLHFLFYRPILRLAAKHVAKILPISIGCLDFIRDFYGIAPDKLEFFPLGGNVPDDAEYRSLRAGRRAALGLGADEILVVQSGKIDSSKKLVEALRAFAKAPSARLRFVIAGHLHPDVKDEVESALANDPRTRFIGWQEAEEMRSLLCAADVYCQPGTQSATMQMSICHRCAVVLDDVPSHQPYVEGNGWLVRNEEELATVFQNIAGDLVDLNAMSAKSHQLALRMLDYRLLAARIYR
jgi:1,2-diacylglycerol 3-alpha-glucosyltransferase